MNRLLPADGLLGSSQAARFLGVSRSTLAFWRRNGEIAATEVADGPRGRAYRYSVADLAALKGRIEGEPRIFTPAEARLWEATKRLARACVMAAEYGDAVGLDNIPEDDRADFEEALEVRDRLRSTRD
jgi:hypothetical protein